MGMKPTLSLAMTVLSGPAGHRVGDESVDKHYTHVAWSDPRKGARAPPDRSGGTRSEEVVHQRRVAEVRDAEVAPGPRHGDVQEAPGLVDVSRLEMVGIEQQHTVGVETLGAVNGRDADALGLFRL